MSLMAYYDEAVAQGEISADEAQRHLIPHFQRVCDELTHTSHGWFSWLRTTPVKGLYLYGPVGVGKTYLMDLFFEKTPEPRKARFHFHHFMQQVDAQLRRLQGQKDPLRVIASDVAKSTRLLCLDEFLVHDVADAMILAQLLQALFAKGVVLVATANTRPDDLYLNGVQRARFLPAIALIKADCQVMSLDEPRDYRLGRAPLLQAYLCPLNATSHAILAKQFLKLASENTKTSEITVQHRLISCVSLGEHVVWFEFNVICNLPRCQLDYLEIADRFHTVLLSNIPILTADNTTHVVLFIHFIDVMYDRGVRLIVSAAVPIEALYVSGPMRTEFQRTMSRLQEMQSEDYLLRHPYHARVIRLETINDFTMR